MKDKTYNLINTLTGKIISKGLPLSKKEADLFNYAFSANKSELRYAEAKKSVYKKQPI